MSGWRTRACVLVVVAALLLTGIASPVLAIEDTQYQNRSAEAMMFDLALLRIPGIAAWLLGTAVFIVSAPFSVPAGNSDEAADKLMRAPANFTFNRPLGDLNF